MHPAHIPFHAEAETPEIGWTRDGRPSRRLFGDHQGARVLLVRDGIELADEIHRLEVFVAAVFVRDPFTGIARVIQIQHGSDGIHAQPVEMELVQPIERARQEEVLDLVAAKIKDQGSPILVLAHTRIGVLIKGSAVESRQCIGILRKMGWNPIQQHADTAAMQIIDEEAEVVGRAEAGARRKIPGALIAPGGVQGMLGDGKELDMGKTQLDHIIRELLGEDPVIEKLTVRTALPGSQMDLVNREGGMLPIRFRARRQPGLIGPTEATLRTDETGRLRPFLKRLRVRVDLDVDVGRTIADLVFVEAALPDSGDEEFPNTGAAAHTHRVGAPVPLIEISDDAHALGTRRPDRELHARHAVDVGQVRAQKPIGVPVAALAEEVEIEIRELGRKAVGIVMDVMVTGGIDPVDSVTLGNLGRRTLPKEKIRSFDPGEGLGCLDQGNRLGARQEHADHCPVALEVPAENLERVVVTRLDDALQGFRNLGGVLCRGCHSEVFPSLSALDVACHRRCHGNRSISRRRAMSLRAGGRRARQVRGLVGIDGPWCGSRRTRPQGRVPTLRTVLMLT